jgi:hypothetical protein
MNITAPFNVSTMVLVAFACWVIYIRTKGQSENSNIPLFYYGVIVFYIIRYSDSTTLPPLLVYASLMLALLLRFEFMNSSFTKLVSVLECCGLTGIVYFNLATIFGWS